MISAAQINRSIDSYLSLFPEEAEQLSDLRAILKTSQDATSRKNVPGHVTCSGLVVYEGNTIIVVAHKFLQRWLLPGGHVEPEDRSLRMAALREIHEELGVDGSVFTPLVLSEPECPIEIDRHPIPENVRKGEPAHEHWDFRFPFRVTNLVPFLSSDEVTEIKSVSMGDLRGTLSRRLRFFFGSDL